MLWMGMNALLWKRNKDLKEEEIGGVRNTEGKDFFHLSSYLGMKLAKTQGSDA